MADPRKDLKDKFSIKNRYSNFGAIIVKAIIKGFRGIDDLTISFDSPITAISGLNGTGKSTIAQLMMSAYKKPVTENKDYKRHHVYNYFPVSKVDPAPFKPDASIEYFYATNQVNRFQELTVRRGSGKHWEGYKRQPERHCRYIGFTIYIPKVEQRDISIYKGNDISIDDELDLTSEAKNAICKILSSPYSGLTSATAKHANRTADIGFAEKFGAKYSENNMGFGEGRIFYTVKSLENAPEQSLFVIEEPETSLHEHAQYEFAKYLMDVCLRRKHQIIITTHSRAILSALPPESRKLLYREGGSVKISDRTSTAEASGILSLGESSDLTIIVEDERAKTLLIEIIRLKKPSLLKGVKICPVGSDDLVAKLTKNFKEEKMKIKAFRDGDRGSDPKNSIYSLPGKDAPEKEVLLNQSVQNFLLDTYGINFRDWLNINIGVDHHEWPNMIAKEVSKSDDGFWEQVCSEYAKNLDESDLRRVIEKIEF